MCPPAHGSRGQVANIRRCSGPSSPVANGERFVHTSAPEVSKEDGRGVGVVSANVTATFLLRTLLLSAAIAFSAGTVCRVILLKSSAYLHHTRIHEAGQGMLLTDQIRLPYPKVANGKDVPLTTFTSKIFVQKAATTSNTVHLDRHSSFDDQEKEHGVDKDLIDEDEDEDEDELHLPAGQHLFVDMDHVQSDFLNSEERLAHALVDLIEESQLTLLSYHCHSLMPSGVSCVGVLLESHVSLHTWPTEGAIVMDLFTCGAAPLIPILPIIKKLFAVPEAEVETNEEQSEPTMLWSHKLRGFRQGFSPGYKPHENPLDQDLGFLLSNHGFGMKAPLVSAETEYQHVDVLEMANKLVAYRKASYEGSLSDDGSYESLHDDLYRPDKVLFLDGVQQSSLYGEAAYHEALVHPSMIAHPNPKRVAIIGGGEGATLREVLKHKTVEEVMMVEIDEELVEICEEYLPEWSNCSDIVGSDADSCFDDRRAVLAFEDAFKWFIDNFGEDVREEEFDVIIMDALDPDKFVEIVGSLYKDNQFIDSLSKALTEEGVFVVQLGESDMISDSADEMGPYKDTAHMMEALENVFESVHAYDEGHSHFHAPWSYLVCFKDYTSRASWYRTAAEIEIELHQRLYSTKSGQHALLFFDAPTMTSYQVPAKAKETTYCRKEADPWECNEYRGVDPELMNIPISHMEALRSTVGVHSGRGLFASKDILKDSSFDMNESVKAFHILPSTWSVIEGSATGGDSAFAEEELSSVIAFVDGYGYSATLLGKKQYVVDSGIVAFCNHGCNGTYNYSDDGDEFTEMNVDLDNAPADIVGNINARSFSPIYERHLRQILAAGGFTTRDIRQGEEILCNYLSFDANPGDWKGWITSLRGQCAGETIGEITKYELGP